MRRQSCASKRAAACAILSLMTELTNTSSQKEDLSVFAGGDMPVRLYGTAPDSIVDGSGLRYAVFVQGCTHACPGCHNPESQPACGGTLTSVDAVVADIAKNGLITGVTLSGGEPFEQPGACALIARAAHERGLNVWAYTGYLYEDLLSRDDKDIAAFLGEIDVLVDGPFVQARKSYTLKWRGSSNQRLIDVPATRAAGRIVIWEPEDFVPVKPQSW